MLGTRSRLGLLLAALGAGLATAGCSGATDDLPRQAVSGMVNLDGVPLESGTIQFTPGTGPGPNPPFGGGGLIKGGRFSIARVEGLVPGTYKVAIYAGNAASERPKAEVGPAGKPTIAKELIPLKYNATTELTAEIKEGGPNQLTFDLKSK